MNTTPDRARTSRLTRPLGRGWHARLASTLLALAGWHVVLVQPVPMRCVVVFYPHTSNRDFVIGLQAKWMTGVHCRFMGKDSLGRTHPSLRRSRWAPAPTTTT